MLILKGKLSTLSAAVRVRHATHHDFHYMTRLSEKYPNSTDRVQIKPLHKVHGV